MNFKPLWINSCNDPLFLFKNSPYVISGGMLIQIIDSEKNLINFNILFYYRHYATNLSNYIKKIKKEKESRKAILKNSD